MKTEKLKGVETVHTHTHTGNLKNKKGITLVALVVTIIILLILAGISIASLTRNGLFEKAKLAKEKQENAQIEEDTTLADYENKIGEYTQNSRDTVTISKEEYEQLKNDSNYSEEERIIGTWVDGSKIYKRTIITTTPSTNGFFYDLTTYNIKKIINVYGMSERSDGYLMALNYSADSIDTKGIYFSKDCKNMGFWTSYSVYLSQNAWITLEYLKNE